MRFWTFFFLAALSTLPAYALWENWSWRTFIMYEALVFPSVTWMKEEENAYLWLGTGYQTISFDGVLSSIISNLHYRKNPLNLQQVKFALVEYIDSRIHKAKPLEPI